MDNLKEPNNSGFGTLLKWAVGGFIVWSLLPSSAKENTVRFLSQIGDALADNQRRKAEFERQERIRKILNDVFPKQLVVSNTPLISANLPTQSAVSGTSLVTKETLPVISSDTPQTKVYVEADSIWLKRVVHPSVILILGKRGSGKSALGYRLLELFRYGPKPYVVGVPSTARSILPDWIGMVSCLEDVPAKAIAVIDEAYLPYHARGSLAQESKAMSQIINLSRQKEQTLIFVTQEARQVDRNIASSANVIVFKDLGMLQLQFDRPELNQLASQAKEAFASVKGDMRRWSYVYAPDTDFRGLIENELPSFWKPGLSRIFAAGNAAPISRTPRKLTTQDKILKAKEMREQGASYREIASVLGVTVGSVANYLQGYPYRSR